MFPMEFLAEVNYKKTRLMALSSSKDGMIIACLFDTIPDCVGQTVSRTDGICHSQYSALHIKLC